MLEKESWPYSSNGAFPCPRNAQDERTAGTADNETMTSNHCLEANNMVSRVELCRGDPPLDDQAAKVESDSYLYSLTEPVRDISFSEQADKGGSNLFIDNWPEIESFEDVDKLFRNSDSTFGLGITNEDNFGRFSSANDNEGSIMLQSQVS